MNIFLLYAILQLDSILVFIVILLLVAIVVFVISCSGYIGDRDLTLKKCVVKSFIGGMIMSFVLVITPTTQSAAIIYSAHILTTNETAITTVDSLINILKKKLEEKLNDNN